MVKGQAHMLYKRDLQRLKTLCLVEMADSLISGLEKGFAALRTLFVTCQSL